MLTGLNLHSLRNSDNPLNDCINYWLPLVHWKLLFIGTVRVHFGFIEMPSNYKLAVDTRCFWWTENIYLTCGKLHRFPHLSCRWLYMDTFIKIRGGCFSLWLEYYSCILHEWEISHISIRVIYLLQFLSIND